MVGRRGKKVMAFDIRQRRVGAIIVRLRRELNGDAVETGIAGSVDRAHGDHA
jgi:hypothetical protein